MESNIINKVFKFKEGAVALISGASSGIGESIATLFSQVGNMNIVITGRRTDRLNMLADKLSINGCKVLPITCDVKDDNAVVKTVSRAVEEFGTIDILINSAGITEKIRGYCVSVKGAMGECDRDKPIWDICNVPRGCICHEGTEVRKDHKHIIRMRIACFSESSCVCCF